MRMMTDGPLQTLQSRVILGFFYLYFLLHWSTGLLMFRDKLGFSYHSVVRYFLGDPELFMNPRSFAGLLEVTHFHLFAMGLFFVVFTHLLMFIPIKDSIKSVLIWLLGLSLLADISSSWLIRYVDASFAWLKLGAFWVVQAVSLLLLLGMISSLFRRSQPEHLSEMEPDDRPEVSHE